MAAPNIVNVQSIYGHTAYTALSTSVQTLVANASGSNTSVKIDSIVISNVNGTTAATVNLLVNRSSTNYYIAYVISVPAGSTFVAMDKSTSIYLEEGDTLQALSSANSALQSVVAYEVIA